LRELSEQFIEQWNSVLGGLDDHLIRRPESDNFVFKRRKIIVVELFYRLMPTRSPRQICVMMHYKFVIICLADVEFKHMGNRGCLSKKLKGVFGAFIAASSMSNTENPFSANEGVKSTVPVLVLVAGC
jgi:D-alanyl-lipoteichoic acid acyltransferase DltB (MBOAT superfamily)